MIGDLSMILQALSKHAAEVYPALHDLDPGVGPEERGIDLLLHNGRLRAETYDGDAFLVLPSFVRLVPSGHATLLKLTMRCRSCEIGKHNLKGSLVNVC